MLGFRLRTASRTGTRPARASSRTSTIAAVGTGPDDAVDLGDQRAQLLAVALREAAGDDQLLAGALGRGVLEDRRRRFRLGRIDERARIDDDRVCLGRVGHEVPPGRAELGDHDLGVDEILRAAEADERDALRGRFRHL